MRRSHSLRGARRAFVIPTGSTPPPGIRAGRAAPVTPAAAEAVRPLQAPPAVGRSTRTEVRQLEEELFAMLGEPSAEARYEHVRRLATFVLSRMERRHLAHRLPWDLARTSQQCDLSKVLRGAVGEYLMVLAHRGGRGRFQTALDTFDSDIQSLCLQYLAADVYVRQIQLGNSNVGIRAVTRWYSDDLQDRLGFALDTDQIKNLHRIVECGTDADITVAALRCATQLNFVRRDQRQADFISDIIRALPDDKVLETRAFLVALRHLMMVSHRDPLSPATIRTLHRFCIQLTGAPGRCIRAMWPDVAGNRIPPTHLSEMAAALGTGRVSDCLLAPASDAARALSLAAVTLGPDPLWAQLVRQAPQEVLNAHGDRAAAYALSDRRTATALCRWNSHMGGFLPKTVRMAAFPTPLFGPPPNPATQEIIYLAAITKVQSVPWSSTVLRALPVDPGALTLGRFNCDAAYRLIPVVHAFGDVVWSQEALAFIDAVGRKHHTSAGGTEFDLAPVASVVEELTDHEIERLAHAIECAARLGIVDKKLGAASIRLLAQPAQTRAAKRLRYDFR